MFPTWTFEQAPTGGRFYDIHGSGPTDLVAAANDGNVWVSSGDGVWTPTASGLTSSYFGVQVTADARYAVGNRDSTGGSAIVAGTAWTAQTNSLPTVLNAPWIFAPDNILVVGYSGLIAHSTGDGTWTPQNTGTTANFLSIWASGPNDIYAVGSQGTILHSTGDGTWTSQSLSTSGSVVAIWGASATDIYAAGHSGRIWHSTGDGTWEVQETGISSDLYVIYGNGDQLYAAGRGTAILVSRGDGVWQSQELPFTVSTVDAFWAATPQRMYGAGAEGRILVGTFP